MKTASDEMYEAILRERAAWKLAKRRDIGALFRLAGDADIGDCGCAEVSPVAAGYGCHDAPPAKKRASRQRQAAVQQGGGHPGREALLPHTASFPKGIQ